MLYVPPLRGQPASNAGARWDTMATIRDSEIGMVDQLGGAGGQSERTTNESAATIDRIINVFPASEQEQIRAMLGETLRGVIAQQLLRKADGGGRVAALEILVVTPAISNLIREGKTHQIASMMQTGKNVGMITMDGSLQNLLASKTIAPEDAYTKAHDKSQFLQYLKGAPPPTV